MQTRIAAVLGVLVLVSGCRVIEPSPPAEAPSISAFTASKTRISPGEEVTLTFAAKLAAKVEIIDDAGQQVQLEGTAEAGTAKVAPTRTSFYLLRVTGAGGRDTAFVQVAVNEPLKDVFLIAVPSTIESGQQAQLLWGAAGASAVTLTTGSGTPQALTGTTGSVTVTPATSERYTLTAQGAPGTPPLTAIASIDVHPVLVSATMTSPDGVKAGKTLSFAWRTAGAARVTVTEATFGPLTSVTEPSSVVMGTFDYVLPATLPGGIEVTEGLPLRFVVSAIAGDVVVTRTITTVVGEQPAIEFLEVPEYVSAGQHFTIKWKTLNASQVTVLVGGLPLFQTLPGDAARVTDGSVSLPGPVMQADYVFVASNDRGAEVRRTLTVRTVALPVISTFTLTPTINAPGDAATARWTTQNATRVQLRLANGSTVAVITTPSQVTAGNTDVRPLTSSSFVLEAFNQAGDVVTSTKAVTVNGVPVVTVSPTPVLRGNPATLTWALSPLSVTEVVGLATAAPSPIANSPNFIDLTTVSTATALTITDVADGVVQLPTPNGFRFPSLGTLVPSLWVSVNGFITYGNPGSALSANSDFTATGNTAPTMLAPFWDDLTLGMNSRVLTALQTSTVTGERLLVVQWDKVQIAGDTASELTFEAQLFETGQVSFFYKTMTGTLTSATVGIKERAAGVTQQFAYNGTPAGNAIAPDMEIVFFSGLPADGMQTFTATASKRLQFFGRTATSVLPVAAEVRVFGPGDVSVTEAMPAPEASSAALGQWIELRNNAAIAVDFDGLLISSLGSPADAGFVIPPGTIVPAGGYLVLGQSLTLTDTGGAPVTVVATDVPLVVPDQVRVTIEGVTLGSLAWDAGVAGTSVQSSGTVLYASGSPPPCNRTQTFGPNGAFGTPGAANESCGPYSVTTIPGRFTLAPAGSEILTTISSDDGYGSVTLPQPFTYYGTPTTAVGLSTNGFLTLGSTLAGSYLTNDTTPSSSEPNGVVALFWDDLVRDTGKNAMWREADRTILSWEGFRMIGTTPTDTQINVQVHLLDTGVIEFHYGAIATTSTTQSTIDRVAGNSATVWIEKQDGSVAVPWAINQVNGIVPNSGLRFTPAP